MHYIIEMEFLYAQYNLSDVKLDLIFAEFVIERFMNFGHLSTPNEGHNKVKPLFSQEKIVHATKEGMVGLKKNLELNQNRFDRVTPLN